MSKAYTRSFAGGEVSPQLFGRLDLAKFQTGLAKCLNFMVTPQGPINNRPGFAYVNKCKLSTRAVLIPFSYNSEQTFAIEAGVGYMRFHTQGGTLLQPARHITAISQANPGVFFSVLHGYPNGAWVYLSNVGGMTELNGRWGIVANRTLSTFTLTDLFGTPIDTTGMSAYTSGGTAASVYEILTPYAEAHLNDLHYVQSADVLTITHPSYQPRELRRLAATNWTLETVQFLPTINTPGVPIATGGGPGGGTVSSHTYVATAIASGTREESLASGSITVLRDLTVAGNYVQLRPAVTAGAVRYNFFKLKNGVYGYIGQTEGGVFRDENIEPDTSQTPPLAANPFEIGAISSVTVTNGGTLYGSVPQTGGVINSVTLTAGGAGYVTPVAAAAGGGSGATFNVTETAGVVDGITITTGGTLYVSPTIAITDSGGPGAGAGATATATAIVDHIVTLTVNDVSGTGAVVEPVVVGGVITGVRVVSAGSGYTAPTITVTDAAGGSGAAFTVAITGAEVNPRAVSYFEQRRAFAGSTAHPQTTWMTRSGTERNMSYSIPTQDDDAITARIVAREANTIRHLVPLGDLLALTSGGVWRITAASSDVLTPSSFSAKPQSYVGASNAQPVVTSDSVLYVADRGAHVQEVGYKWETQRYRADDISVLAPHLFDYKSVLQLTYAKAPVQTLWAVRSDGVLLGLTHMPEHDVRAWHKHETQGAFESIAAIAEGSEDGVYAVIARTVRGQTVRYIERLHTRQFDALADAFFVDSGLSYSGAGATSITGLHHLEGLEVSILADGGVEPRQTVTNGAITLEAEASTVHVGLPYNADAQTMPLALEAAAAVGQGVVKNVNEVTLRLHQSSGIKVGPTFDKLTEYPQRLVTDDYGVAPGMVTGTAAVKLSPKWQEDGAVCIRQSDPLPLTILSLTLDVTSGG
jgi:hypothetical protein